MSEFISVPMTYMIVRYYCDNSKRILKDGLTHQEAIDYINNPTPELHEPYFIYNDCYSEDPFYYHRKEEEEKIMLKLKKFRAEHPSSDEEDNDEEVPF